MLLIVMPNLNELLFKMVINSNEDILQINTLNNVNVERNNETANKHDKTNVLESKDIMNAKENISKIDNNDLESILSEFKVNGLYHVKFIILVGLIALVSTFHCTNYIFVAEETKFDCKYSNCNATDIKLLSNSSLDFKCLKYSQHNRSGVCTESNFNFLNFEACDEWNYHDSNSFVAEFNLGCEKWKSTLVGTIHSVGYMIGLLLIGPLSDKFGRKALIINNAIAGAIIGLSKSFVTSYWLYIALELLGATIGDPYSATYTLSIETVTKKSRPIMSVWLGLFSSSGSIIKAVIAWLSPNWRVFLRIIYGPGFLFILYIFWLDESMRWLINHGNDKKAAEILRKAAKMNNIKIDESKLSNLKTQNQDANADWKTLLKITIKSRKLFLRLLGCACVWFTTLFNAYTLAINSVSLEGNKYLNYGLVSMADIPGCGIMLYLLTKCKRKLPLIVSLMLTGVVCAIQSFVSKDLPFLSILLYAFGRMNAIIGIRVVYLYTSEIFPTYTRNTMHALCSALGRFSIMLSPQTPLLLQYWSGFPSFLVGVLSLLTAVVVTFMPDSSDDVLPDNVEQAEGVGDKKNKVEY